MKDYVIKATSGNGQVRAYVGITKNLVQTARDNHNTIKVATAALGIRSSGRDPPPIWDSQSTTS